MKRMSIRREIAINKKQNKNRMTGQTFNPSGITSQQIKSREDVFVADMKAKTKSEINSYWENIKQMKEHWQGSYPWEWCAFIRHFVFNGEPNLKRHTMDLFDHWEKLPKPIQKILGYLNDNLTYDECESLKSKLEPLGYTFDYYLDAVPYNLRKI